MKTEFSSEEKFIEAVANAAQKASTKYGYLASVLIAQACLEVGYGIPQYWDNSEIDIMLKYNNILGMKSELLNKSWNDKTVWNGKSFIKHTPEWHDGQRVIIEDSFRKYSSAEQCFSDFILFLTYASNEIGGKPKYGHEVIDIKNPKKLITTVSQRGYATDPRYAETVMNIIKKHNLTKYDDKGDKQMNIIDVTAQNASQVPDHSSQAKQFIVVHYLGVANADNENLYGGGYGGHYYVSRAGQAYKAAKPENGDVVWHCGGGRQGYDPGSGSFYGICTNYNSIGIETGVNFDGTWYFTQESQETLAQLVAKLMKDFGIGLDHVIRHWDVTGKHCPAPYVENNNYKTNWTWNQFKNRVNEIFNGGGSSTGIEATKTTKTVYADVPFSVKVLIDDLYIRSEANGNSKTNGFTGKGQFTITKVSGDWGKLKSGAGWIYLKNPEYVDCKRTTKNVYTYKFNGLKYNDVFSYETYYNKYKDLQKALGKNYKKLFEHFCTYGMNEGRQAKSTFILDCYRKNYVDLRQAFGNDFPKYYKHYIEYGKKEGRVANKYLKKSAKK